jgi:hypothetical protein
MRRPAVLLALGFAGCLAGCLPGCGGGGQTIPEHGMSRFVLRQPDVGAPFISFYRGQQTQLDNQGTSRAAPERYGREGGWIVRYRRSGSTATNGPLLVESRVDVFRDEGGAKKDLDAYRAVFAQTPATERRTLALPKLGDAGVGQTFVQPGPSPVRFYRIAWRYRNATASVLIEGFGDKVSSADALALAQKQQQHLQRA